MENWPYWVSLAGTIITIYLVISVLLYFLQDQFLFKPEKLPKDLRDKMNVAFDLINRKSMNEFIAFNMK